MALLRASGRWSARLINQSARAAQRRPCTQPFREIQKRGYASGGEHTTQKSGSDLPWAIGATVVTVPSLYYLLQPDPNKSHGHGHGHGDEGHEEHEEHKEHKEHEEHEEQSEEAREAEETTSNGEQDLGSEKSEEPAGGEGEESEGEEENKSDDSGNESGDQQTTPDTSENEGSDNVAHEKGKKSGGNVEGVQFKGATKAGDDSNEQTDTRKHIPDPKGYNKLRIESDYGMRQGVSDEEDGTRREDGRVQDKPATAKAPKGEHSISNKQEGLSNTDTKYPFDIANNPEKSKKGEGVPETAKSKGTVDPGRPQAENRKET